MEYLTPECAHKWRLHLLHTKVNLGTLPIIFLTKKRDIGLIRTNLKKSSLHAFADSDKLKPQSRLFYDFLVGWRPQWARALRETI